MPTVDLRIEIKRLRAMRDDQREAGKIALIRRLIVDEHLSVTEADKLIYDARCHWEMLTYEADSLRRLIGTSATDLEYERDYDNIGNYGDPLLATKAWANHLAGEVTHKDFLLLEGQTLTLGAWHWSRQADLCGVVIGNQQVGSDQWRQVYTPVSIVQAMRQAWLNLQTSED